MLEMVWRKGNPLALLVGIQIDQPLWKIVWRFLNKLRRKRPYDPTILLLGIYPEKMRIEKAICTSTFIAALFKIAGTLKQPICSLTNE